MDNNIYKLYRRNFNKEKQLAVLKKRQASIEENDMIGLSSLILELEKAAIKEVLILEVANENGHNSIYIDKINNSILGIIKNSRLKSHDLKKLEIEYLSKGLDVDKWQ